MIFDVAFATLLSTTTDHSHVLHWPCTKDIGYGAFPHFSKLYRRFQCLKFLPNSNPAANAKLNATVRKLFTVMLNSELKGSVAGVTVEH